MLPFVNARVRHRRTLAASLLACVLQIGPSPSEANGRPVGIEDFLRLEATGRAIASPKGDLIVYDRMPPYKQRPDFGVEASFTEFSSGRLMLVDANHPQKARLLIPPKTGTGYWGCCFSPKGDRVAFYMVRRGHVSLGVCDLHSRKVTVFGPAPQFRIDRGIRPVWLDDDHIAYAAMAPGGEPWRIAARRMAGAAYAAAWEKSWRGREPSFREATSPNNPNAAAPFAGALVIGDVATGKAENLASGLFVDTTVSSDGRYLAALRQYPLVTVTNALDWVQTRSELWLFDMVGKTSHVVSPDKANGINLLSWEDGGHRLAFYAWPTDARPVNGVFHVLEADTGKVSVWPHTGLDLASARERGQSQEPERPVWFGGSLLVFARPQKDGHALPTFTYQDYRHPPAESASWYRLAVSGVSREFTTGFGKISPILRSAWQSRFFVVADGDVWELDADGAQKNLTQGRFGQLQAVVTQDDYFGLAQPSRVAGYLLSGTADGRSALILVHFADEVVKAFPFSSFDRPLAQLADSGAFLIRHFEDGGGSSVKLGRLTGSTFEVDRLNDHLRSLQRERWLPLTYTSSIDGSRLTSCLMLPNGAIPGKPLPLIVYVYPSLRPSCDNTLAPLDLSSPNSGDIPPELLTAQGYAYLKLASPPQLQRNEQGPLARQDRLAVDAVNAAVQQGYADARRVGLLGASQGGISVLSIATQTDAFASVVSMNGWADPWRHYFDSSIYETIALDEYPFGLQAGRYEFSGDDLGLGATPWSNPERFLQNSPLAHADRIHAPVLLINSDMDSSPVGEYEAMFTALYRLHKTAKLLTYWGEGHGSSSPANIRHAWTNIIDWFALTLKPDVARSP